MKEGVVSSVAFGPDGRTIAVGYVAVGTGGGVARSTRRGVRRWRLTCSL